jgi:hypothetical protein
MLLKDEDVHEFKKIYEDEFSEPLTEHEASIIAARLMTLYEALCRPLPLEGSQFTDSGEGGKLDLEAGPDQSDEAPASERSFFNKPNS